MTPTPPEKAMTEELNGIPLARCIGCGHLYPLNGNGHMCRPTPPAEKAKGDVVEVVARVMASADGLDFDEVCGFDTEADECNSGTCVAAGYEDHDPAWAREVYLRRARAVLAALQSRPADLESNLSTTPEELIAQAQPLDLPAEPAGEEPVGEAAPMAGSNGGFTMVAFEARKVPAGTKLYTRPADPRNPDRLVEAFVASLTNNGRNRDTMLSINHDELRALVAKASATPDKLGGEEGK